MVYSEDFIQKVCGGNGLAFDGGANISFPQDTASLTFAMEVTAHEVKHEADIQGIQWNKMNETREDFREKRVKTYEDSESSDDDFGSNTDDDDDQEECSEADSGEDQQNSAAGDSFFRSIDSETDKEEDEDVDHEGDDPFLRNSETDKEEEDSETNEEEDKTDSETDKEEEDSETNEEEDNETADEEDKKEDDSESEDDGEETTANRTAFLVMNISDREDEEEDDDDDDVKEIQRVEITGEFYEFFLNTRQVQPAKTHGQLSDLVWATSRDEVYALSEPSVVSRWSAANRNFTEVVRAESFNQPTPVITAFAINETLWVGGGFKGELMWKRLNNEGVDTFEKITDAQDAIITSIQLHDRTRSCIVSSNDQFVRMYDSDNFQFQNSISVPFPVNAASLAPDRDLLLVGGDSTVGFLGDLATQKKIADIKFQGRLYALTWHPNSHVFATCTEDNKCQLWDVRSTRHPFKDLKMLWKTATSAQFSADGEFLVVGEPDFVNIYSSKDEYTTRQQIDFFGGLSGLSLSPDGHSLFVGITDYSHSLSSLLVYHRLQ